MKKKLTFIQNTIVFEDLNNSTILEAFSLFLYLIVKFKCKFEKKNVDITSVIK